MPEPPDFEQLALAAIDASFDDPSQVFSFPKDVTRCRRAIVEQLRQVWNARGAADAHAVTGYLNDAITLDMVALIKALDR